MGGFKGATTTTTTTRDTGQAHGAGIVLAAGTYSLGTRFSLASARSARWRRLSAS